MTSFTAPRRMLETDTLQGFCSGVDVVDSWVRDHALRCAKRKTAVVYVSLADDRVAGLYSLSSHSVLRDDIGGGWLARNSPRQIPTILLGMLGVDRDYQGMGLGGSLLADAIERSAMVSESIGAKALLVDPANGEAEGFYRRYGFKEVPGARRLFLPLALRAPCPANESRRTDA